MSEVQIQNNVVLNSILDIKMLDLWVYAIERYRELLQQKGAMIKPKNGGTYYVEGESVSEIGRGHYRSGTQIKIGIFVSIEDNKLQTITLTIMTSDKKVMNSIVYTYDDEDSDLADEFLIKLLSYEGDLKDVTMKFVTETASKIRHIAVEMNNEIDRELNPLVTITAQYGIPI